MMKTLTLKPQAKTMYTVQPEKSHSRVSLRRVLYMKFLRWIDKTPSRTIARATWRCMAALLVFLCAIAPAFTLGFIGSLAASKWLYALCASLVYLNYKIIVRQARRSMNRSTNQHCFNGVPIPELSDFLLEAQAFPVADSIKHLRISQPQQKKIADTLEKHGVLIRGENNARVLRNISRVELVKQLESNFPLEWAELEEEWVNKRDTFSLYALDREKQERKEEQRVEKRERKLHRIENKIQELQNPFTLRELSYPLES